MVKQLKLSLILIYHFITKNRTPYQNVHTQFWGALIAGIAAIAGSIISASAAKKANKQNLQYNQDAYNQQRQDALSDYNKQTEYNNPTSQMARLREAGLNPILAAGNISSNAPAIRSSDYNSYQAQPVDIGPGISNLGENLGSSIGQYLDYQLKTAQLDNLKRQNTVITQDALLRQAQTESTLATIPRTNAQTGQTEASTAATSFDLSQRQRLADISAQAAEANLAQTKAQTQVTLNQDERAAALNAANIQEAATRILKMRAETANTQTERSAILGRIEGIQKDNALKELDIELKKKGIQPTDAIYWRVLSKLVDNLGGKVSGAFEKVVPGWKDLKNWWQKK